MTDVHQELNIHVMQMMSDIQKTVFLKVLLFASKIDGRVDDEEIKYIKKMAVKYHVENVKKIFEPATKESLFEELECILRRRWKLELIKELFRLAHADDDLGKEELSFIDEVSDKMGIEKEKTEQISNWIVDFMVWKEQGKIIFEENGKWQ